MGTGGTFADARLKVFIADGSPAIRERLDALLSEIPGIAIIGCAGDGEEAIARIRASEPHVVILDSSLPPAGGLSLLRTLRSTVSPPVVIAITSSASLQYRILFREAGAVFCFDKSCELERLVEALGVLEMEHA
jgi:DNA-binding NarL/FixJ family response regulator